MFSVGQTVTAKNNTPFEGKKVAPPLVLEQDYPIKAITLDKAGNQHLDLGLVSLFEFITSIETGEELPGGDKIHWVHPLRVILKA